MIYDRDAQAQSNSDQTSHTSSHKQIWGRYCASANLLNELSSCTADAVALSRVARLANLNKIFVRYTNRCSEFWFVNVQQPVWSV